MEEEQIGCPQRGDRFFNRHIPTERRTLWDFVLWKMGKYDGLDPIEQVPASFHYPAAAQPFQKNKDSVVWIGHSTFLIESSGERFLTDPVWATYCSPMPMSLLKRRNPTPFPIQALPPLKAVLISHNHYDHLDRKAILQIADEQPGILWIIPKNLTPWFHSRGIPSSIELDWWESIETDQHRITAVPAQHFSGRTLWDKNKTLWNGYIVEHLKTGKKFYFVGDTGYNPVDFKQIGRAFSPISLSLIPIGTYEPRAFMSPVHISPYDAVQIHSDIGSAFSVGMHWNTFCLSQEPFNRPPYDLYLAMKEKMLSYDTFLPINIGAYVNW